MSRDPHSERFPGRRARGLLSVLACSALLLVAAMPACARAPVNAVQGRGSSSGTPFSGKTALKHAVALAGIGPRYPGSPGHEKAAQYILSEIDRLGVKPEVDSFAAQTPLGPIGMKNILVKFPGKTDRVVLVGGHWDTKRETRFAFVGANDGGSSTGFLLELARVLKNSPPADIGVWLAFFDGEEPLRDWTRTDSLYGSRRMAGQFRAAGTHRNIAAVVIVDMIGDRDLDLLRDLNSTGWLNEMARDVAGRLTLTVFGDMTTSVEDDHVPFAAIGLPVIDLIDLNYGPNNSYWHTAQDTPDKLSAESLTAVGRLVLGLIDAIARRK